MAQVLSPRHVVVIRSSEGVSFIRPRNDDQIVKAVKIRENRGAVIHKVACSASCWCEGQD